MTNAQRFELISVLSVLPPDKVAEITDFALFLKERYAQDVDISDEWTDEDIADLRRSSLRRFEEEDDE